MTAYSLNSAKLFTDDDVWCILDSARSLICELRPASEGKASLDDIIIGIQNSVEGYLGIGLEDLNT